jgi:large subunit ribosomal protein L18
MKTREETRKRRKLHIRKKVRGTSERPRVFIFRSNKHTYLGLANDEEGKVKFSLRGGKNRNDSVDLAKNFAKKLKESKVEKVVFDRSGYKYTGAIKVIVDTLRESGVIV